MKVRQDLDVRMTVLASLYKEHQGTPVVTRIAQRDPALPSHLVGFKSVLGNSWQKPKCEK